MTTKSKPPTREQRAVELLDAVLGESTTRWRKNLLDAAFRRALKDAIRAHTVRKKGKQT